MASIKAFFPHHFCSLSLFLGQNHILVKDFHSLWGKRAKIQLPMASAALWSLAHRAPCRGAGCACGASQVQRRPLDSSALGIRALFSLHLWVLLGFVDVHWALQGLWRSSCLHPPYHRCPAAGQVGSECGCTDITNTCPMTCVCWRLSGICLNAMLNLSLACPNARGTGW